MIPVEYKYCHVSPASFKPAPPNFVGVSGYSRTLYSLVVGSSTCLTVFLLLACLGLLPSFVSPAIGQEILPFPPAPSASTPGLTIQDSTYKKRVEPKRLADGAPNILIILMDDVGPATPSTYGGEINTPTLDRVAKMGVSFNRFHSTAMCSPTRASLLTGRNHTFVGNGQIAAIANDFDGFSGVIPKSSATVAEVLKNYGYNTGAWGKWHNTPEEQITSKGPFDYWPTGYGFEYFYGFLAGEASQYEPTLTRNTTPVTEHLPKGYHLTDDIATDAIKWLREQKAYAPDKPFFMYWAPGASHGPHQVMKEWADKYKGKFDDGWDKYRERVFAKRQGQGLDSAERPTHAAPRFDGFVGFHSRGRKTVPAPPDGSLRRFHRARRLQCRPGH